MKRFFFVAVLLCSPALAQTVLPPPVTTGSVANRSTNPDILVNEDKTTANSVGTGAVHSLAFNNDINRAPVSGSPIGAANVDGYDNINGSYNYDHHVVLQCRTQSKTTGNIHDLYCSYSAPQIFNGSATNVTHHFINDAAKVNGATVGTQIGIQCAAMSAGTTNYCIKSDAPVYINEKVNVRGGSGELARFSTRSPTSADRWITVGAEDLNTEGGRIGYNGSTGNMWMGCNYATCKFEILTATGVKITGLQNAPSGSKALCFKDGEMFVSSSSTCP